MRQRWPWELCIDTSKAALERFARAVVMTRAKVLDSGTIGRHELGRGVSCVVLVSLVEGTEEQFREVCRPIFGELKPPPLVQVGMDRQPDDGHPGRKR